MQSHLKCHDPNSSEERQRRLQPALRTPRRNGLTRNPRSRYNCMERSGVAQQLREMRIPYWRSAPYIFKNHYGAASQMCASIQFAEAVPCWRIAEILGGSHRECTKKAQTPMSLRRCKIEYKCGLVQVNAINKITPASNPNSKGKEIYTPPGSATCHA